MPVVDFHFHVTRADEYAPWLLDWLRPAVRGEPGKYLHRVLTIIMAHSGRGFWYDRAFFLARLHEHVYMEITGLPPQKLLAYFPELEKLAESHLGL